MYLIFVVFGDKRGTDEELGSNCKELSDGNEKVLVDERYKMRRSGLKKKCTNKNRLKKYFCDYDNCHKSFADNYHLVRHIKSCHTLEKPFKCLKCDKRFAISERLAQHVKTIHKKDYTMFTCVYQNCDFQAILEDRLKAHLAKHEAIHRFGCSVCHKSFITKYELIRHKHRNHDSKPLALKTAADDQTCDNSVTNQDSCEDNGTVGEITGNNIDDCLEINDQTQRPVLSGAEIKKQVMTCCAKRWDAAKGSHRSTTSTNTCGPSTRI
jgi:hypothetical protein